MAMTAEQRQAAKERMLKYWEKRRGVDTPEKVRAPEVQAIIDAMPPERKAKLERIQAQTLAVLQQTNEGQRAMERFEQGKRVAVTDMHLRVSTDGTMVSVDGPCLCGKAKREWHVICLRSGEGIEKPT